MARPLVLAAAATLIAGSLQAQAPALTPHQKLARDVYKELVEINTVDDSIGSSTKAAEAMAARFRAAGFPERDVQVLAPPDRPRKGNLVVRYRGRAGSTAKPILLLAHLDVVAALRSDWPRDPFTLHEENGFFLGRGTSDDKSMASMFVANLLRMKSENFIPDRDLVLALTADEEGGPANGVQWLIRQHKELIDASYALNEGGGGTLAIAGAGTKPIFHSVQAAEKFVANFTLTATNTGGHSSVPRPDNAIYSLADALARIARNPFPVALNSITTDFFAQTAKVEPQADLAAAMRALVANPSDATAIQTLSRDARYNSMMRTTCVATRLTGGHANNALPQTATANINCRIVPTSTMAATLAELTRIVADTGVKFTGGGQGGGAAPSTIDADVLAATTDITKRMFGDIPVIPTMSTGATDGRMLRAAGIPTFGVSGIFSVPGETNAHGQDEKLRVKSYYDGLEFLDRLVRRLTGAPRM